MAKKSYLRFDLESEIWHGDSHSTWGLLCKILCKWFKAFGQSDIKYTQVTRIAEFLDPLFEAFMGIFESHSCKSATKFCVQVNMHLEICFQWRLEILKKFFLEIALFEDFFKILIFHCLNFCRLHPKYLGTWPTLFFLSWAIPKAVSMQNFKHVMQNLNHLWLKNQI